MTKKQILLTLIVAVAVLGLSALSGLAAEGIAKADKKFILEAAEGGMMEVQLGQLAQQNGQSPDVKQFGSRMVTDHGKGGDELKALAQQKGVTLPAEMQHKHKAAADKLGKRTGAGFDRMYIEMMLKDHIKDVGDFRKEGKKAKDPDLKAWVDKTLPMLEQHLQQARDIAQKMGMKSK